MINPFRETNWHPDAVAKRAFGRSLIIGFPILAVMLLVFFRWKNSAWIEWPVWLGGIGASVGALCCAVPAVAKPFYFFWYGLACCIGIVVSNAILVAIFYLVVTPVGLLLRAFGKDPLERRFDRTAATYWKPAEKDVAPSRYFRQF